MSALRYFDRIQARTLSIWYVTHVTVVFPRTSTVGLEGRGVRIAEALVAVPEVFAARVEVFGLETVYRADVAAESEDEALQLAFVPAKRVAAKLGLSAPQCMEVVVASDPDVLRSKMQSADAREPPRAPRTTPRRAPRRIPPRQGG